MTEKTPKTPHSDQPEGVIKNQTAVSGTPHADRAGDAASGSADTVAKTATDKESTVKRDTASLEKPAVKPDATAAAAAAKASSDKPNAAQAKPASDKPAPQASSAGAGGGSNGKPPSPAFSKHPKKPSSVPLAVVAVAVVLLAGVVWYQHTTSQNYIERLEAQAASSAEQARQAAQQAQQALSTLSQQQTVLTDLRSQLKDSRAELDDLSNAFQTITDRGSDLVLLNDIDHLVMIAQQQLQLNGNVANAIISLETAQAQLSRANRPTLASLQQTINGDLDRLRAATTVDIALLSSRLDELAGLITQAPLLVPDDAVSSTGIPPKGAAQGSAAQSQSDTAGNSDNWWQNALAQTQQWSSQTFASLRHELGQFISVRRVDDAAALLISPDQAARFRDSLRQRIMTAQLALMMDQSMIWETETDALLKAVESRFDPQSASTRHALKIARDIADTPIDAPLPDVTNSIKALEAMSEQMGRPSTPPQQHVGGQSEQTTETPSEGMESSQGESESTVAPDAESSHDAAADAATSPDLTPGTSGADASTGAAAHGSDGTGTDVAENGSEAQTGADNAVPPPGVQQSTDNDAAPGVTPDSEGAVDSSVNGRADEAVDDSDAAGSTDEEQTQG